jgi:diguanylate cyclase (GGDEF)-like protein
MNQRVTIFASKLAIFAFLTAMIAGVRPAPHGWKMAAIAAPSVLTSKPIATKSLDSKSLDSKPLAAKPLAAKPLAAKPLTSVSKIAEQPLAANSRLDYQQAERLLNQLTTLIFVVGSLLGLIISLLLDKTIRDNQRIKLAHQELERLASLDGLTQVANRRAFENHLQQEWARAVREKYSLTLILCDVDHFKTYNDTYGHQAGDDYLRQLAQAIHQTSHRPGDLTARYGGEEFAIVLPHTQATGGIAVAHKIQSAVAQLGQEGAALSLSIGIASVQPTQDKPSSLLMEMSDRALFTAKERGRNQIVCLEQEV